MSTIIPNVNDDELPVIEEQMLSIDEELYDQLKRCEALHPSVEKYLSFYIGPDTHTDIITILVHLNNFLDFEEVILNKIINSFHPIPNFHVNYCRKSDSKLTDEPIGETIVNCLISHTLGQGKARERVLSLGSYIASIKHLDTYLLKKFQVEKLKEQIVNTFKQYVTSLLNT